MPHAATPHLSITVTAEPDVHTPGHLGELADGLPERRTRTRQHVIRHAIPEYRAKSRDVDRGTYPAALQPEILRPAIDPAPNGIGANLSDPAVSRLVSVTPQSGLPGTGRGCRELPRAAALSFAELALEMCPAVRLLR